MEKWAVDLASPTRTMLSLVQRLLRIIGKLRHIERLMISGWPSRALANTPSRNFADCSSSILSRPARTKVSGSVSMTQVERPGSYW